LEPLVLLGRETQILLGILADFECGVVTDDGLEQIVESAGSLGLVPAGPFVGLLEGLVEPRIALPADAVAQGFLHCPFPQPVLGFNVLNL